MKKNNEPRVIGGIGEKKSNGGTQFYEQNRIYDNKIATAIPTSFQPYYLTNRERESDTMSLRIRKLVPLETLKLMGFERKDEQATTRRAMHRQPRPMVPLCLSFAISLHFVSRSMA